MKEFEDGFIPSGWGKGERLRILKANPRDKGFIQQADCIGFDEMMDRGDPLKAVAFIEFRYEDAEKVTNWIKWWGKETEDE